MVMLLSCVAEYTKHKQTRQGHSGCCSMNSVLALSADARPYAGGTTRLACPQCCYLAPSMVPRSGFDSELTTAEGHHPVRLHMIPITAPHRFYRTASWAEHVLVYGSLTAWGCPMATGVLL